MKKTGFAPNLTQLMAMLDENRTIIQLRVPMAPQPTCTEMWSNWLDEWSSAKDVENPEVIDEWTAPFGTDGDHIFIQEGWRVGRWNHHQASICIDYIADNYARKEPLRVHHNLFDQLWHESIEDAEKALGPKEIYKWDHGKSPCRIRTAESMQGWAARVWFKVTGVKVSPVQAITEEEAIKSGIMDNIGIESSMENLCVARFADLWNFIYKNWKDNPWVFVYDVERIKTQ